jgi:hypothetical protein
MAVPSWLRRLHATVNPNRAGRKAAPFARPRVQVLEDRVLPSAYVVTTTADSGVGSLRDAIMQVNADPSVTEIDFNITAASDTGGGFNATTGVATIAPLTALPAITNAVLVDGYTQAGASPNTFGIGPGSSSHALGDGSNAILKIELNGSSAGSTASGLVISGQACTLRGLVINRFGGFGIDVEGNGGSTIAGDFIGTDPSGTIAEGNCASGQAPNVFSAAVEIGSSNNLVGGLDPASRNLISGNNGSGVDPAGSNNRVQGNLIGTDVTGTNPLGNASDGIGNSYGPGPDTLIGGTTPDARNIISANTGVRYIGENGSSGSGIYTNQAGANTLIQGNYIGTDVTGTKALGNHLDGVVLTFTFAPNVLVGGTDPGAGNVISGNFSYNVGGNGLSTVQGNLIGTDYTGTITLGGDGVFLVDGMQLGGGTTGSGNLVMGLVRILRTGNTVQGNDLRSGMFLYPDAVDNLIGTNGDGVNDAAEGNHIAGSIVFAGASNNDFAGNTIVGSVQFSSGADGNTIGGTVAGTGNDISGSQNNAGVAVDSGATGDAILGNSIHDNPGGGIDLGPGANNNQPAPVLTGASSAGGSTTVSGTLAGAAGTAYRVEVFANPASDPSGFGQGQTFLGFTTVTGGSSFTVTFSTAVPTGAFLSATATDPAGNTSAFSRDRVVNAYLVTTTADSGPGSLRQAILDADTFANGTAAQPDLIQFAIPTTDPGYNSATGAFTITPQSHLPFITDTLILDGYSQPGASPNTLAQGDNAVLKIQLNLSAMPAGNSGLNLTADYSTIRGLVFNGRSVDSPAIGVGGTGDVIAGNFIGTDVTGTQIVGNLSFGIDLLGANEVLGGTTADARNIISGNGNGPSSLFPEEGGVYVQGSGNSVVGNYIGTDATGTKALGNGNYDFGGNGGFGVLLTYENNATIGGTVPGAGNLISGNQVGISGGVASDRIQGNLIGTDVTGTSPLGNGTGILLGDGVLVGGTAAADRNIISGNGTGIFASGAPNALIEGNYIGTDITGTKAVAGEGDGIWLWTNGETVGGTAPGAGNVISGSSNGGASAGIRGFASNEQIQGNLIGTDYTGTKAIGNTIGINFQDGGNNNVIGGTTPGSRNVISGNGYGVIFQGGSGPSGNVVEGNFIGTDLTGTNTIGNNGVGVGLGGGATNNTIGGTSPAARNIISGNGTGIGISGDGNVVEGNYIGTDVTGTHAMGNGDGVDINVGANNLIGGTQAGSGNVISGNALGINLVSGGNLVEGNLVGTDATGASALANRSGGIISSGGNTIGGTALGTSNIISGNTAAGILLYGSGSAVEGNFIGTDITGTKAVGNFYGVGIQPGASNNTIGGTTASARNIISGNYNGDPYNGGGSGVSIEGTAGNLASNNTVEGNYIGTDVSGEHALGNSNGVWISAATNNIVSGNVIAASGGRAGVGLEGFNNPTVPITGNLIQGNLIGTDASGTHTTDPNGHSLGNPWGVEVDGGATGTDVTDNTIGGTAAGQGNLITGSSSDGVFVFGAQETAILGNSIHDNGGLGTDLSPGTNANNDQAAPALTSAINAAGGTIVTGTLTTAPNTTFRIEFFDNPAASSGNPQGQTYLGFAQVRTDASGHVVSSPDGSATIFTDYQGNTEFLVNLGATSPGDLITATATDPAGNTSQFSAAATAGTFTASAGGPFGQYGTTEGVGVSLSGSAAAPAGLPITYSWTINGHAAAATGASPTLTWAQLQALGIDDGPHNFTLSVTASDGYGVSVTSAPATLALGNTPPTPVIHGAPVTSPEGTAIALTATATDPSAADTAAGFTFAWSVTKNGSGYVSGMFDAFSFTPNDNGTYVITLTATDKDGATRSVSQSVTVTNVPPTASLSGPTGGVLFQPLTFTLGASDPSGFDQDAGFTFAVNWGDTTSSTVNGLSGVTASHAYSAAGTYTVKLTATDKDGGVSAQVTQTVVVVATPQLQGGVLAVPGTTGSDTFTLTPVLSGASYSMKITRTTGSTTTNLGTFAVPSGLIQIYGGPGTDAVVLNGSSFSDAFSVGTGTVGVNVATGTAQTTAFTIGLNGITAVTLKGGGGTDSLTASNQANAWVLTGSNAGTLNGNLSFASVANLTGGTGNDTFRFAGGSLSGNLDGQGGTNTLDYSQLTTNVSINLATQKATSISGTWANVNAALGGSGSNTLTGANGSNTWTLTSANAGSVNGFAFTAFQNLTGGTGDDTFRFVGGNVSGKIDGGAAGTNTLDYSASGSAATVNLQTKTATSIGTTWANINAALGTGTTDTLVGANTTNTWNLTSTNAGNVNGTFAFTGFPNLTGGSGADTYTFSAGAGVTGVIDGQGGTNALNYAAYSTGLYVNLLSALATGTGGIHNIRNVTGGLGNDILVGDANADVFTETAGRNILIGGAGADTLTGGSGGDILIGGTTDYDTNAAALQALLANWTRTDLDYSHRVALLLTGVSYTDSSGSHTAALNSTTVHDDAVVDTLTGGSGPNPSNWFFAHQTGSAKDKVNNRKANETVTSI